MNQKITSPDSEEQKKIHSIKGMLWFVVFVAIIFLVVLATLKQIDLRSLQNWEYLRQTLVDLGFAGIFVFILMVSILPFFSSLILLIMTGSAVFGPFYGFLFSYIGTFINANLVYLLVRSLSIESIWGTEGKAYKIKKAIQEKGYPIVLIFQLVTVIPFVLVNGGAGAAGIKWRSFIKATSIGVLPCVFIFTFVGDKVISNIFSPEIYLAGVIALILCITFISLKKTNIKKKGKTLP
jgi:uncharacterized membrane protein YdjX (TVP38/TMEM64 family)